MNHNKLKIIHITEALGGGVLNIIRLLASAQASEGHIVTLAHSVRSDTPCSEELNALFPAKIKRIKLDMITNISPYQDLNSIISIIKLIKIEKPNIVHLHSSKAGALGRLASFFTDNKIAFFYTPHGFSFLRKDISQRKRKIYRWIEKTCAFTKCTIVACSQSEFDHATSLTKKAKVLLVENGIPLDLVTASKGSQGDNYVICTSGRLCPPKNPSAFGHIAKSLDFLRAKFLWIGDGELVSELFVKGELPQNIYVTGWVARTQVAELLNSSDIFIMTSLWEGMPLSLIEAQASGLPAVVPAVEGCRDVVINGVTGFICPTTEDMIAKIKLLIEDDELRITMGQQARSLALQRFSPERMHLEMLNAYTSPP